MNPFRQMEVKEKPKPEKKGDQLRRINREHEETRIKALNDANQLERDNALSDAMELADLLNKEISRTIQSSPNALQCRISRPTVYNHSVHQALKKIMREQDLRYWQESRQIHLDRTIWVADLVVSWHIPWYVHLWRWLWSWSK